jgi:pseudaminic acid biosynthesis-associated methylase
MGEHKTEQEGFWAGAFGDEYIQRNQDAQQLANQKLRYAMLLRRIRPIHSAIEFGANVGINLKAIHALDPSIELSAIEINAKAVQQLKDWGVPKVYHQSILQFEPDFTRDLALISGVLIHINPDELPGVYAKLRASTKRFLFVAEYFNPTPVEVPYRGHGGKLFKRDFAGEMLDLFSDLRFVDCGFDYGRDPRGSQDNASWFLLEKTSA